MQEPLATGPASWGFTGWLGLAIYLVTFVLLLRAAARLAAPTQPSETDDPS